ncbi:MAG: hypothetical protein P0Y52_13170 [Candidatus Brevundimonas phytovorans]|nr:hypothetical protein [Brevundimonas sp.]WEK57476.1 MAG: hypothetical protein P0Y52_13170 [Brevundimonas sp.]
MKRFLTIGRLSALFFSLFAVMIAGVFVFQRYWMEPGERCEAEGKWYDMESRICAQPISIAEITGRPIGVTRAQASAEKNKELIDIEDQLNAEKRARAAATEAERARVAALQR